MAVLLIEVDFNVRLPLVVKVPAVKVSSLVMLCKLLPLVIVAPVLLFKTNVEMLPTPLMVWEEPPFKVMDPVPDTVPLLVRALETFSIPLFASVTPLAMLSDVIETAPVLAGAFVVPDGMVKLILADGGQPVQLLVVLKLFAPAVVPFQVPVLFTVTEPTSVLALSQLPVELTA